MKRAFMFSCNNIHAIEAFAEEVDMELIAKMARAQCSPLYRLSVASC